MTSDMTQEALKMLQLKKEKEIRRRIELGGINPAEMLMEYVHLGHVDWTIEDFGRALLFSINGHPEDLKEMLSHAVREQASK